MNTKKLMSFCIGCALGFFINSVIYENNTAERYGIEPAASVLRRYVAEGRRGSDSEDVVQFRDSKAHHDDTSIADKLAREVTVMCFVLVSGPENFRKVKYIRATWGKRCTSLKFLSANHGNATFDVTGLQLTQESNQQRLRVAALQHIYDHYGNQADWFLLSTDEGFVVMENLRLMLLPMDAGKPVYFGSVSTGDRDLLLSKTALKTVAVDGLKMAQCSELVQGENTKDGLDKCFVKLGVQLGTTTDKLGKQKFINYNPQWKTLSPNEPGIGRISDRAISFHDLRSAHFYELEFFLYHLRPYGIIVKHEMS